MKTLVRWSLVAAVGLVLVGGGLMATARGKADAPAAKQAASAARYQCPMHPDYTSDKPGDCPICGMKLIPIQGSAASAPADNAVPGRGTVTLTTQRRQLLGVRSEEVKEGELARVVRTVGRVAVDERRLRHVHTKYEGYVEHLYVDFTGKLVRKGEPLLSVYSPELVATQQEYLLAHRAQAQLGSSNIDSVSRGSIDLHEAARQRLLFWDIRPADIARLEKAGEVKRTLDLYAEIGGYVVEKMAYHGMRVTPADTLFDIADLSHLWVLADVYERDLACIRLGTRAEITLPHAADRKWTGVVTYVAPVVEEKTRTVKVRLEVDNRDGELKPDMYADVFLKVDLGNGVVIPDDAVVDAGDRRLVFLDRGEGRFEPREVRLGARVPAGLQVLSGLAPGERIVTSANFLLDSESSLKAALSAMSPGPGAAEPESAAHAHAAHVH